MLPDYFAWKNWTDEKHYKTNQIPSYGAVSEISQMNVKELEGFLIHKARQINIEPDEVEQQKMCVQLEPSYYPRS
jgi:hypothetical protein